MFRTQTNRSLVRFIGVFAAVLGVVSPVLGATDMFLKIEGIPGESTDDGHADWIEIVAFNHGISQPVSGASGTGGRTGGRADFMPFSVTKTIDKGTADLHIYWANGKHIPTVEVEFCLATGDKHCFMKYTLTDVIVSAVSPSGSQGGDRPMEKISFTYGKIQWYGKIKWEYTPIDQAGAAGATVDRTWNLETNKQD